MYVWWWGVWGWCGCVYRFVLMFRYSWNCEFGLFRLCVMLMCIGFIGDFQCMLKLMLVCRLMVLLKVLLVLMNIVVFQGLLLKQCLYLVELIIRFLVFSVYLFGFGVCGLILWQVQSWMLWLLLVKQCRFGGIVIRLLVYVVLFLLCRIRWLFLFIGMYQCNMVLVCMKLVFELVFFMFVCIVVVLLMFLCGNILLLMLMQLVIICGYISVEVLQMVLVNLVLEVQCQCLCSVLIEVIVVQCLLILLLWLVISLKLCRLMQLVCLLYVLVVKVYQLLSQLKVGMW